MTLIMLPFCFKFIPLVIKKKRIMSREISEMMKESSEDLDKQELEFKFDAEHEVDVDQTKFFVA